MITFWVLPHSLRTMGLIHENLLKKILKSALKNAMRKKPCQIHTLDCGKSFADVVLTNVSKKIWSCLLTRSMTKTIWKTLPQRKSHSGKFSALIIL